MPVITRQQQRTTTNAGRSSLMDMLLNDSGRTGAASNRSMSLMPMNGTIDAAQAVDQQVPAQQQRRRAARVFTPRSASGTSSDDDEGVEDHRRQDRALRASRAP